jgi:hypothetical protein
MSSEWWSLYLLLLPDKPTASEPVHRRGRNSVAEGLPSPHSRPRGHEHNLAKLFFRRRRIVTRLLLFSRIKDKINYEASPRAKNDGVSFVVVCRNTTKNKLI